MYSVTFALIRNAVNFYLPFVDDSIDAVEVEFMRWRLYWLRHEGDSLAFNTLSVLLSAKEIHSYPSLEDAVYHSKSLCKRNLFKTLTSMNIAGDHHSYIIHRFIELQRQSTRFICMFTSQSNSIANIKKPLP